MVQVEGTDVGERALYVYTINYYYFIFFFSETLSHEQFFPVPCPFSTVHPPFNPTVGARSGGGGGPVVIDVAYCQ